MAEVELLDAPIQLAHAHAQIFGLLIEARGFGVVRGLVALLGEQPGLPQVDRAWLGAATNCFLIRDPRDVIASYTKKNNDPTLEDIGFVQQAEIFDWVRTHTGAIPAVIDARDVLENPRRILELLCDAVGVEFSDSMLSWPPGLRETDGIWARHWYGEVVTSTTFRKPSLRPPEAAPARLRDIHDRCRECYDRLHIHRLR